MPIVPTDRARPRPTVDSEHHEDALGAELGNLDGSVTRNNGERTMTMEPIPHADDVDVAEQARSVDDGLGNGLDDGLDEGAPAADELGADVTADVADVWEQHLAVSAGEDEHREDDI